MGTAATGETDGVRRVVPDQTRGRKLAGRATRAASREAAAKQALIDAELKAKQYADKEFDKAYEDYKKGC